MDRKILQVTPVDGKPVAFGSECVRNKFDGGYYAVAWDTMGAIIATTRVYRQSGTAWRNLKRLLTHKYGGTLR